jgi:hypothetical protein
MTRTDIAIADMLLFCRKARRTGRDENSLVQVLLNLEAETRKVRDEVRAADAARLAEYPPCEE